MRAKGSNMHHMRTFVTKEHGDAAWEELITGMSAEDAESLRALVPVSWYPLALQHRLLAHIDASLGSGDGELVRRIGRYEAEQDLKIIHRLFLRAANPAFVMEKAGDYWSRFYSSGLWGVQRGADGRSARATLEDVEPTDADFCVYLSAYIMRMFELVGARDVSLHHSTCRCRGAASCVFEGAWR